MTDYDCAPDDPGAVSDEDASPPKADARSDGCRGPAALAADPRSRGAVRYLRGTDLTKHLGVPERIVTHPPTADLESLRPQLPDEEVLGLGYDEIDDFLEGRPVRPETQAEIIHRYNATAHKRTGPITPPR